jgi:hypothetical protein
MQATTCRDALMSREARCRERRTGGEDSAPSAALALLPLPRLAGVTRARLVIGQSKRVHLAAMLGCDSLGQDPQETPRIEQSRFHGLGISHVIWIKIVLSDVSDCLEQDHFHHGRYAVQTPSTSVPRY